MSTMLVSQSTQLIADVYGQQYSKHVTKLKHVSATVTCEPEPSHMYIVYCTCLKASLLHPELLNMLYTKHLHAAQSCLGGINLIHR